MKCIRLVSFTTLLFLTTFLQAKSDENSLSPMLTKVMPSVVNIRSQHQNTFGIDPYEKSAPKDAETARKGPVVELGSGVIIDAKHGIIVTNAHVVHDASTILVTLNDNRKYLARLIGEDIISDLAILHIEAKNLQAIDIGRSKHLQVGDTVTAIGNPFGLHQTVTSGIVSGLHRNANNSLNNFIQTDAPINPGNSGGALIDLQGELVGINTAILSTGNSGNIGIGFAIPSDMMVHIVEQLIEYKNVKRGMLGVTLQELTPQLATALHTHTTHGAIINTITPHSAAEAAGMKEKDIIVNIDDQDIYTADEAKSYIGVLREGTKVAFSIERNNKMTQKYATLGSISALMNNDEEDTLGGMALRDYDEMVHGDKRVRGVMVTRVRQGSKVWLGGIDQGDVIVAVNKQPVTDLDSFSKATKVHTTSDQAGILLEVKKGLNSYFIVVE
jgi:Do/DeqQ family serine protease